MSTTTFTPDEHKSLVEKITWIRMVCLPGGALGLWAMAAHFPAASTPEAAWGWYIFWVVFTSYFMFCWTSCFHECAHQTLHHSKWVSILVGRILGIVVYVPYQVYRESHIRHHAYLNKPADWELWPYSDPKSSLWFRRCFVWFDILFGNFSSPLVYGRIYWHKDSPIKDPKLRWEIFFEYILIVLVWGGACAAFIYNGLWMEFLRVWGIPVYIAGMYQTFRKLTEHLGMSSYDPMLGTRTVLGSDWFTKACTFCNFDIFIHGPHHRHPRVAHNQLGTKMQEYIAANPDKPFPLYKTYFTATWAMLPYLFTNPGVGMNAGAPAPGKARDEDVRNFVSDVSKEVLNEKDLVIEGIDMRST